MKLKKECRDKLKIYLAEKVPPNVLKDKVKDLLSRTNGRLITVGDISSYLLSSLSPFLSIIDFSSERKPIDEKIASSFLNNRLLFISNKSGTINEQAIDILKNILSSNRGFFIVVDGEEDLLALPVMVYAKEGDIVVYGLEGYFVPVVITNTIKNKIKKLLNDCFY